MKSNRRKKPVSICIILMLLLCLVMDKAVIAGETVSVIDSGSCGDNAAWVLYSDGVLDIEGEGSIQKHPDWSERYISDIKKVIINEGISRIECYCFYELVHISEIQFPDTLVNIEWSVFDSTRLEDVEIPDSVALIGNRTFEKCRNLKRIKLPSGLLRIENGLFGECTSISNIDIPETVEYIGMHAFYDCCRLEEVRIPASVTYIGADIFYGCSALKDVYFEGDMPYIDRTSVTDDNILGTDGLHIHYPVDNESWKDADINKLGTDAMVPTASPKPVYEPTATPALKPTPTVKPTGRPPAAPSPEVTEGPTGEPSAAPDPEVTEEPTGEPSAVPGPEVTEEPTGKPPAAPGPEATEEPTDEPSAAPRPEVTVKPTDKTPADSASPVVNRKPDKLIKPTFSVSRGKTSTGRKCVVIKLKKYQGTDIALYLVRNGNRVRIKLSSSNINKNKKIFRLTYSRHGITYSLVLRTYKKLSGKKIYSPYSAIKKIKV